MCGRYNLRTPAAELARQFELDAWAELAPRYNIAPTQPVPIIRQMEDRRRLDLARWGLVPFWADDPKIGNRMINARAESVASKPSFRAAFRKRRCLLPADGFYEWKKTGGKTKQPFHITHRDRTPFAFAGLWESWDKNGTGPLESCTIITTDANDATREIHDRMPVILPPEAYPVWLDPDIDDARTLEALLRPCPAAEIVFWPVSTLVNSPANDVPECVAESSSEA